MFKSLRVDLHHKFYQTKIKNRMKLSIKKILVPTDFSEISLNALDYAGYIAKVVNAEVVLLHVYESYEQNTKLKLAFDFSEIIEKGINDKMEEIKRDNKNISGVKITTHVKTGKIHQVIEEVSKKEKVDLIVMGTHGASGLSDLSKFFLGSNAYRTINNVHTPVITIRKSKKNIRFKDIILPIDTSKETMQKVETAIEWAKVFEGTIHLLGLTAFFDELVVQVKDLKKTMEEVQEKLEAAGVPYVSKMIRHQALSESVLSHAKKVNADLIFMMADQGNAFSEMILRSSSQNIVNDSPIPVLSMIPKKK